MVVVFGFPSKRHPVAAKQSRCPACGRESVRVSVVDKRAFTLFWIPVLPLGSSKKILCLMCGAEEKIKSLEAAPGPDVPPAEVRPRLAALQASQFLPPAQAAPSQPRFGWGPPPPPP